MRLRVVLVALLLVLSSACAESRVALEATAKTEVLPLFYGLSTFDPPGDVVPRMMAEEALAAWDGMEPPAGDGPEVLFALYSDSGSGQMLDNGLTRRDHFKQPVWLIRYTNVPGMQRGGMRFGVTTPSTTKPILVDLVGVVDDATGAPVVTMNGRPEKPAPKPKSCPEDLSDFETALVDDGTPLPAGGPNDPYAFTQPHATILASDRDGYSVWGGVGSIEHPAAPSFKDGVLVVSHAFKDPCKSLPTDEGGIVFHHEPSQTGVVTVTSVAGDSVRYRTADGTTGTYNVVTRSFSS